MRRPSLWFIVVGSLLLTPIRTSAQGTPDSGAQPLTAGTGTGLFGSGGSRPGSRQSLDFMGSLFWASDSNITPTPGTDQTTSDRSFRASALYPSGDAGLSYARQIGHQGSFAAHGATSAAYFRGSNDRVITSDSAGVGLSIGVGQRGRISASEAVSYAPYYFGIASATQSVDSTLLTPAVLGFDFSVATARMMNSASSVLWSTALSRRATFEAYYNLSDSRLLHQAAEPVTPDFLVREQRAGFRFRRQLTSSASLRLGYGYRFGEYGSLHAGVPLRGHDIEAGVDYGKSLLSGRRTTFTFSSGSTVFFTETGAFGSPVDLRSGGSQQAHFALTGNAALVRRMGRTWSLALGYDRSVGFIAGFTDPWVTNAAHVNLGGLASRRVSVTNVASYLFGSVGYGAGHNGFTALSASSSVQYAVTRHIAGFAQYVYYHYDFGHDVTIPNALARGLDRQGLRAGVRVRVPLLR